MRLIAILLNPSIMGIMALFLSVIWMLRDEKDKTRPLLVFAVTINLIFAFLLTTFMGKEGSLLPWKFDHVLARADGALGISAAAIARHLQGFWRRPLIWIYQLMVPMMICWFLVVRYRTPRVSIVLAYVAELIAGPIFYAIFPACGPIYAFGPRWLNPPEVEASAIHLVGMPNAFPSLHVATAFIFVILAPGKLWKAIALAFFAGTVMATMCTGEHYVIDLIPGFAFGCFAASVGLKETRRALLFLGIVLCWSLTMRFEYSLLIAYPIVTRTLAVLTMAVSIAFAAKQWLFPVTATDESATAQ